MASEVKAFNKWSYEGISVTDMSLNVRKKLRGIIQGLY
jgi:hypothetical protein